MLRQKLRSQVADVFDLLKIADAIESRDPGLSYSSAANVGHKPLIAGAIVLLCGRFEEFLQDVVTYAIDQHAAAVPSIKLSDLSIDQQAHIVTQNFTIATRKNRYGKVRTPQQRVADVRSFSGFIVSDKIWSDFAVETGGNPGSETVGELLKIVGVVKPWDALNARYTSTYQAPTIPGIVARAAKPPAEQLNAIVEARNQATHTGAHLSLSSAEVAFYADYLLQLAEWLFDVLKTTVDNLIASKGATPPVWT